jgi:hypothetical protein
VTSTDALWGGTLAGVDLDATTRSVTVRVEVTSGREATRYSLLLRDVSLLRLERPDGDWDYTEVTEVHVGQHAAGASVELIFWNEPNGLFAECSGAEVRDG